MTGSRVCLQGAINQPVLTTQAVTFHPPQETSLRTCPRRQEDNKSHERSWVPTLVQASYLTVATYWEEARGGAGDTEERLAGSPWLDKQVHSLPPSFPNPGVGGAGGTTAPLAPPKGGHMTLPG